MICLPVADIAPFGPIAIEPRIRDGRFVKSEIWTQEFVVPFRFFEWAFDPFVYRPTWESSDGR